MSDRQIILWFKVILVATSGDLVAAYEILVKEALTRSLFFACGYGAARGTSTLAPYLLGPVCDIPVIRDYIATAKPADMLERGSKLVSGGVAVVSMAGAEIGAPEFAAGAAGRAAGELVNLCENELKESIRNVMESSNATSAWMEKYILGDETLTSLRGGAAYLEPDKNCYIIIKIITVGLIMVVTFTLIKGRSKIGKFFKKINPKKLYRKLKTRRHERFKFSERLTVYSWSCKSNW